MNQPEENDPLDALLREQTPYIPDNGFTARVVASLPKRRAPLLPRRSIVLLVASLLGWILAALWLPWNIRLTGMPFTPHLIFLGATMALVLGCLIWVTATAARLEA